MVHLKNETASKIDTADSLRTIRKAKGERMLEISSDGECDRKGAGGRGRWHSMVERKGREK